MNIKNEVLGIQQKWINKLARSDAEYFLDYGTQKDLCLFCTQASLKRSDFKDQNDLSLKLVRYLQLHMIMSHGSEDPRDKLIVQKFSTVPFMCESLLKGQNPYHNVHSALNASIDFLEREYPLSDFWEKGAASTKKIEKSVGKLRRKMLERILSYYSTPIVAYTLIDGVKKGKFDFFQELQFLLKDILQRHFKNKKLHSPDTIEYIEVMEFIVSLK